MSELGQEEAQPAARSAAAGLPCLNRKQLNVPSTWKRADDLMRNVEAMAKKHGLEKLGFFTLTFKDQCFNRVEAQRRFNSFNSNVLRHRYADYIAVFERHESGAIHYHLLVLLSFDCRSAFNFERLKAATDADKRRKGFWASLYPPGHQMLREWAFWRKTCHAYGFGRHELLPIKSTAQAIGRYIGKYLSKHMNSRRPEDKGVRLVRYAHGGSRQYWPDRSALSGLAWLWRKKLEIFVCQLGMPKTFEALRSRFGPKWAYKLRVKIMAIDLRASPGFVNKGYPDYYTMILDDVIHGRPMMSEEVWQNSQDYAAHEASERGETFVPEDYTKCMGRALRLVPIYRPKIYLLPEVEGYEDGPY